MGAVGARGQIGAQMELRNEKTDCEDQCKKLNTSLGHVLN